MRHRLVAPLLLLLAVAIPAAADEFRDAKKQFEDSFKPTVAASERLSAVNGVSFFDSKDAAQTLVSGIADALAWGENGKVEAIIDWKSDVEVLPDRVAQYLDQLRTYRDETGADRALLVFMTPSQVLQA